VLSHPPYSHDLVLAGFLLFTKLKIAKKGTRFNAVSLIQQTVMRELKAIWDKTLSDGINKYLYLFMWFFMDPVQELNCHTVYADIWAT
jgi:hypothetical protein